MRLISCPINSRSIFRNPFWIKSTFLGKKKSDIFCLPLKWVILSFFSVDRSWLYWCVMLRNWQWNNNVTWFYKKHNWKLCSWLIPLQLSSNLSVWWKSNPDCKLISKESEKSLDAFFPTCLWLIWWDIFLLLVIFLKLYI